MVQWAPAPQYQAMETTVNDSDPTADEGPEPPARTHTPRRLYRHPRGAIGGVASGFAAYFDVDPVIIRLIFIIGAFAGPGLPAYLICWIAIPKATVWPPKGYGSGQGRGSGRSAGLTSGLIAMALAALAAHSVDGVGDYVFPAVLIGFGVFLLSQPRTRGRSSEDWDREEDFDPDFEDAYEDDVRPARQPEMGWGRITPAVFTLLCLLGGIAFLLQAVGVFHVSLGVAAAVALVAVGIGLLATLRYGRAPGLIPLGMVLSLIVAGNTAFESMGNEFSGWKNAWAEEHGDGRAGVMEPGEHRIVPDALQELQGSYRFSAGKLELDLSRLNFDGVERSLDVRGGAGEIVITLPARASLDADVRLGVGEVRVLDQHDEGFATRIEHTDLVEGAGRLVLTVRAGAGEVEVLRVR